ncbi:MAG: XRE family transcriptional regulator [Pontiellaceae bacterium]|nr:XRE family transcriptional regulator [Pontiellaceae bacterium]
MKKKHVGSSFDDFLNEEGISAEVEAKAIKRVLAFQIEQERISLQLSKVDLAKRMKTSRTQLDRLLDPDNPSVTLLSLENAAVALGKKLSIGFI